MSPPVAGAAFDLWVLASSGGESARVAGALGLPLAANYHVSPSNVLGTVEAYRSAFRPGVLAEPYVVVSADVLVAETTERARHLADPFAEWVLSIRRGAQGAIAYPEPGTTTPWEQRSAADQDVLRDRIDTRIVGTPDEVAAGLATLQRVTGADELLVTTETHDPRDRVRSFELLADAWGLHAERARRGRCRRVCRRPRPGALGRLTPTTRRSPTVPVDFLGIATTSDGSETQVPTTAPFDLRYLERIVRAHEDNGWTRVLFAYGSSGPEPSVLAAHAAARLDSIELLLAHRPNVSYPTFAAKSFATLDQLSGGRLSVHFITGGNDHEQQREGDTLTKDQRYARTQEYIQIVKRAWTSAEPFDHDGEFYQFRDFVLDAKAVDGRSPTISFGGSSDAAYRVGAAEADIYAVWGEPLDRTAEQIARIRRGGRRCRTDHAAAHPRRVPADHRAHRGAGLGEGAPDPRRDRGPQGGGRRRAEPAPPHRQARERRVAAAAGDRRAGRPVRLRPLDGHGEGHRRRRQLERARRHARAGRGGAAGVLRPRA